MRAFACGRCISILVSLVPAIGLGLTIRLEALGATVTVCAMNEDSLEDRLGPRRGRYKSTPLVRSLRLKRLKDTSMSITASLDKRQAVALGATSIPVPKVYGRKSGQFSDITRLLSSSSPGPAMGPGDGAGGGGTSVTGGTARNIGDNNGSAASSGDSSMSKS